MLDKKLSKEDFRWLRDPEQKGERQFTFGGDQVFNLFQDYPHKLSEEERAIFDEVNPFWTDFFKDRE